MNRSIEFEQKGPTWWSVYLVTSDTCDATHYDRCEWILGSLSLSDFYGKKEWYFGDRWKSSASLNQKDLQTIADKLKELNTPMMGLIVRVEFLKQDLYVLVPEDYLISDIRTYLGYPHIEISVLWKMDEEMTLQFKKSGLFHKKGDAI